MGASGRQAGLSYHWGALSVVQVDAGRFAAFFDVPMAAILFFLCDGQSHHTTTACGASQPAL